MAENETIIIFSANYPPHIGGVERYTFGLQQELCRRKQKVVIVTSSLPGLPLYENQGSTEIYRIPSRYFCAGSMPIMLPCGRWRRVLKKLLTYPNPKILVQTMLYPMSLFAVSFAKKHGLPCIVLVHGTNYARLGNSLVSKCEHGYERFLLSCAKRKNRYFYAVSQAGCAWMKQRGCPCQGVLYNSVDHEKIEEILHSSPRDFRKKHRIPQDDIVVTYVGRLIEEKGVLALTEGFSRFHQQYPRSALVIVGDGPLLAQLRQQQTEQVVVTGALSNQEALCVLAESNVHCLPSFAEGLPTTILEAILCGCYNITSPYGGGKEIIASLETGYVMEGNSPEDIFRALTYYAENRALCEQVCQNSRSRFFGSDFTWQATCDRLEQAFSAIPSDKS